MATKAQPFHFINGKLRQSNLNDLFIDRSFILVYSVVMIALLVHLLSTTQPLSAMFLFFLVVSMNA